MPITSAVDFRETIANPRKFEPLFREKTSCF
jgi:hypothetical protein